MATVPSSAGNKFVLRKYMENFLRAGESHDALDGPEETSLAVADER